jgi:hypothetical protein
MNILSFKTIDIPLEQFKYCDKSIIDKLYEESETETLNKDDFLKAEPTEAYKNNKLRIAREEKEKIEWEKNRDELVATVHTPSNSSER